MYGCVNNVSACMLSVVVDVGLCACVRAGACVCVRAR